ncbi:unnamed protein product [Rotaria magnacalcarata]|uniref:F-box domain-containing protein n=1 Tax=Rotaria magnacalcarata TaxID=392030 RepID=A0A819BZA1_9BILA|nr:unnamed protein product [Rotaria magnacalcarata]
MINNSFELLPNEVLLIIFSYLSSFDLCQAFLDLKNSRIKHLLTSIRHSLDAGSIHYNQLREFLNSNNDYTKRFTALIDTVILNDSSACMMLLDHWEKNLNALERLNIFLPSVKKIFILNAKYYEYGFIHSILIPLVSANNALQYLHLVFERPTNAYRTILSNLIRHHISLHTMILEVQQGHIYYSNDRVLDFHKMVSPCWPNTIQLTLSIQHSSELILLLQRNALPAIEHLSVTNEDLSVALPLSESKSGSGTRLCEHDLRERLDGTRLRYLLLRYLTISDVVILLGSLTMPLLEKLILVDLYDHTLDFVGKFQEVCGSTYLPALKHLHFSFCFPQEIEDSWRISSFDRNGQWPFDNLAYYKCEIRISDLNSSVFSKKALFVVYKGPINLLFHHKRTFRNHCFAEHASVPIMTTRRRLIQWIGDLKDEPDRLMETLRILASGRANELHLTYSYGLLNESIKSRHPSSCELLFHHLRFLTFNFESESMTKSERVTIIKQILHASPNLSHLAVAWNDFRDCSHSYLNLRHVNLILERLHPEPTEYFNIDRLAELVPDLRSLETSGATIKLNENLAQFVWKIIHRFDQLMHLIVNKDCLYRSKHEKKIMFKERLLAVGHDQLFDCNNIEIEFHRYNELRIWL